MKVKEHPKLKCVMEPLDIYMNENRKYKLDSLIQKKLQKTKQ